MRSFVHAWVMVNSGADETYHLNFAQTKAHFTVSKTELPVIVNSLGEFMDLVQCDGDDVAFCVEFYFS